MAAQLALILACVYAYAAVVTLAMGGSRSTRIAVAIVSSLALAAPIVAGDRLEPFARGALALGVVMVFGRTAQLAADREPVPAGRRFLHAIAVPDMRHVARIRPSLARPELVRVLAFGLIGALAMTLLVHVPLPTIARWIVGGVFAYVTLDAFVALVIVIWRGAGFDVTRASIHDDPLLSRTVVEFWGRRWNRVVGSLLRSFFFMPFARRGRPWLGIAAAFAASTLLHVYLAWIVVGARGALLWGIFFAAQLPIVWLERRAKLAGRAWTIGVFVLLSPLFVDPFLAVVGVR